MLLSGCGAMFSDDQVTIQVSAPDKSMISLDGIPVGLANGGHLEVSAHTRHIITATAPDGRSTQCDLDPKVQKRYIAGDIFLIEMVFPIVIDAFTDDWGVIETTHCSL